MTTPSRKKSNSVSAWRNFRHVQDVAHRFYGRVRKRIKDIQSRRPHRSFRRTRRRDFVRSLALPGYWSFTLRAAKIMRENKKIIVYFVLSYSILYGLAVQVASQNTYTYLSDTLQQTSGEIFQGNWGEIGKAGLLVVSAVSGGLNEEMSDDKRILAVIFSLLGWLTIVWILRARFAGEQVRLRDGIYNAGAPIISTFLVSLLFVVQLLPLAVALIGYAAARNTIIPVGGVEAMLFWLAAGGLGILSLYWAISTFFALIVITLPGMYPMKAIRIAGDMVIGRRLRLLFRMMWLSASVLISWALILLPIILLITWLRTIWPVVDAVPIVPSILLLLSSMTIVWVATYVYLLYRKVVDDDAKPA